MDIEAELATLCRSCGLCCDGSLFGRVMLERGEIAPKRLLRVFGDGRGFDQPCNALTSERSCAVYEERPRACRRFVCRLHDRHRREGGSIRARIAAVLRVRELIRDRDPDDLAELQRRVEQDFGRA
jgi:hypothetical protein